jgi:hypothetical protein
VVAALVHASFGVAADLLGIGLVASWRLRAQLKTCFSKKRIMRLTLALWVIAFVLSFILYLKIIGLF